MRSSIRAVLSVVLLASLMSGCAVIQSSRIDEDKLGAATGTPYMLPKALLPIEVIDSNGGIKVSVLKPIYVGDPAHIYALSPQANAFGSDNIDYKVDTSTGLLQSVTITAKDNTLDVIMAARTGITPTTPPPKKAETAGVPGDRTILSLQVDPAASQEELDAITGNISATITSYLDKQKAQCKVATPPSPETCANYERTAALKASYDAERTDGKGGIKLSAKIAGLTPDTRRILNRDASPLDCMVGFCHRVAIPYEVTIDLFGTRSQSIERFPNGGPTLAVPIKRYAFVTSTYTITLTNGTVTTFTHDRPSSFLELAASPLTLAKAVLRTIAEVVQLKIDLTGKEEQLFAKEVALIKQKEALEDLKERKAESARLSNVPLLTVSLGNIAPRDVLPAGKEGLSSPGAKPANGAGTGNAMPGNDGTLGNN